VVIAGQRVIVSDKSFGGELKVLKKYFQYRNFDKGGTGALFLPNTMRDNLIFNPAIKPGCYNRP